MRIIGGSLRGRRIAALSGAATRPTSDRVREAIASALQARAAIEGARVLDAFAGTGALGLEALSRGAASALCVDKDKRATACVRANAEALGLSAQVRVLELDLLGPLAKVAAALQSKTTPPFDLVFADPPYTLVQVAALRLGELAVRGLLAQHALLVIEHGTREVPARPAAFSELASYRYGDTGVLLWETIAEPAKS